MAHKRKDTLVAPIEWAKHLRPFGKRMQNKLERKEAKKVIAYQAGCYTDDIPDSPRNRELMGITK